jgi:stress response protein YsnF
MLLERTPMSREPLAREERETVLSLHAENIAAEKRRIVTGHTRFTLVTRNQEELVREVLAHDKVKVQHVSIGRAVDHLPRVRQEGDTVVIPVMEEVLTINRQLILKEEIRIRRVRVSRVYQERIRVRRQDVLITHQPLTSREETQTSTAEVDTKSKRRRNNGIRENSRCVR